MGRGDYMVNNVRLNLSYLALDTDLAYAKKAFDVHFWGMVHITQIFMPQWIESKATVTINASLAGTLHVPWGTFYNASKAAIRMYSETLPVEVTPLGVNVVTIMTSIVASKMFDNTLHANLPEISYYHPSSKHREASMWQEVCVGDNAPATYAKGVVSDVLRGHSGMTWKGRMALIRWFLYSFFPTCLADLAIRSGSGLENI